MGFNINSSDHQGRTALHYAVDLENSEITNFLLINGADVNAKDNEGKSPYDS